MKKVFTLDKNAALAQIEVLQKFQDFLFDQPHNFWHCACQDDEHGMPFYYYQRNRIKCMSTCSVCMQLIQNKRQIIRLQKLAGVEVMPPRSCFKSDSKVKVSATGGQYDPNRAFLGR